MRRKISQKNYALVLGVALVVAPVAHANDGKLLATGAVTTIEGSGGGGIVPWATTASYAEDGEWGFTVNANFADVDDFQLGVQSLNLTYGNRIEVSYAQQRLGLNTIGGDLKQQIYGLKVRLLGDLVYGDLPQVSLGVQHKRNTTFALPQAVGAKHDSGTDIYLSAAKAWLAGPLDRTWVANLTLRATKANQLGLLGFGGDQNDDYQVMSEASLGMFVNRHWLLGVEYRQKPDNLGFARESDWRDVFVGWFPTKSVAMVVAYTDLKGIAGLPDQSGAYASLQISF
ncbi:hypothetical protein PSI9734_00206 [Pseudidiomarina piscicola]|uniref:DUF3034 domain-containing protein n=2 Tax=Pseudidiomarina piscicola TaxID=2614830 RepID=A0A6S6WKZ9_9GAMM|nr:hypothetical protein PSI9734_00206 [Pseudidiomarina piscicola]VZT39078.1 hypothetical protein PSI9734_00206 [Pseudomonas aeruginosa]